MVSQARFPAPAGHRSAPGRLEARQDCSVLWASPSGRTIFTQCGQVQRLITGDRTRRVRLALIVQPAGYAGANTFA